MESKRCTSCSLLISRLKMATDWPCLMAELCAMLKQRLVLPILGRAARIIKSERCDPPRSMDQATQDCSTLDNAPVVLDVSAGRYLVNKRGDIAGPTHFL